MYRIKSKEIRINRNLATGKETVQVCTTYEDVDTGFEHMTRHPMSRSEYEQRKYYDTTHRGSIRKICEAFDEYMSNNEW